jgi:hypothetical protein
VSAARTHERDGSRAFVTVVSGPPRSGTSLAMQMLRAGGMPVLADEARPPDTDNPAGYLEYAPVLRTATDASWVASAPGHAVKVIYALLRHLPRAFEYRVLWMRRDLGEVIASQQAMLARRGAAQRQQPSAERLASVFAAQLDETERWLGQQPAFRVLALGHRDVVTDARSAAAAIDAFLGGRLDRAAMASAVDPALYRQRTP